jgi:hypothetical protein
LYVAVVVSLGCSPRKQWSARCRHDEVGLSYEPDLLFVSKSVVSNLLAMAGRHHPICGDCERWPMRAVACGTPAELLSPQFERDNKPSDLNVLRRLERFQAPMHHTEFAMRFVFPAITSAQGTDPNPIRMLAISGNF